MYAFYVYMDNEVYGPYSAYEILGLELLDDTLVTEESMNGQWLPASQFDFADMARKEGAPVAGPEPSLGGYIDEYGQFVSTGQHQPVRPQNGPGYDTRSTLPGAGAFALICSFLLPIVGVILYFVNKDKVRNPGSYLTWAGISFAIGLIAICSML